VPDLIDKNNTASDVWADTAYRSKANEKHLADNGLRSQIHRKKPKRCYGASGEDKAPSSR